MEKESYKVSVIVPIFNVEKYIEHCAQTLFEQTLLDIEYIFVNDATLDNSIGILKKCIENYPDRSQHCHVLTHTENLGLPAARNTGMALAHGKYIFHCDGDDFVERDMLEKMVATAEQSDADIIWSDWYLSYNKRERYMKQPSYNTVTDALKGILLGKMKYNVWNKLINRELYFNNNITFPKGYSMGEDMTIICLFACAKNIVYIPEAFYHYVKTNTNAMTATWSEKHLRDLCHNVTHVIDYIHLKFADSLNEYINYFKLNIKLPCLITDDYAMYDLWNKLYVESNLFICKNKMTPFRTRLVQWMAWKKQYWFVWLYYKFIYKFIYTFILRYR